jgi:hypothetical protein
MINFRLPDRARSGHAVLREVPDDQWSACAAMSLAWEYVLGAGDENRTRTISLGSRAVPPGYGPDLVTRGVSSSRG